MRLELQRRPERSRVWALLSPVMAVALTVGSAAILLAAFGIDPGRGLYVYFVEPLTSAWSLQELCVKAAPLVLIAIGLSVCFLSNSWNIGAEGQYIAGAALASWLALVWQDNGGPWLLPAMLVLGALGGALYGAIPALLKIRFGANEILTSLMLVYVAELGLDYLVRGPWRDPQGFNFPQTVTFNEWATMPLLPGAGRLHLGVGLALLAAIVATVVLGRTLRGFEVRVVGMAPRAARFAGVDDKRMILVTFLISGALAGLAGIGEVAGPIGQVLPTISPGYGFTAIIVAFLGRLNPIGILIAGLLLALTVLGGESAQIVLQVPLDLTNVLQGLLLFFVLACDTLILYRIRFVPTVRRASHVAP